jgi:hypothetical protein
MTIVSYLHNYIFIKTKKTGGTTTEMTLAPSCGPHDVVTPLSGPQELIRGNGRPLCRNFSPSFQLERDLREAMVAMDGSATLAWDRVNEQRTFFAHMPAADLKHLVAPEFWQRATKITVERHPYEKAVSRAYFNYRNDQPFEQHLDAVVKQGGYRNYRFYSIGGEVVVDELLKLETLHADLARVGRRLGISIPDQLVQANGHRRGDKRPAREILTDAQKEKIYQVCRSEFELLGYQP